LDAGTVFETERLILRPLAMNDLASVFERTCDPEVMRFHNCGPMSLEDTQAGLEVTIARTEELLPLGVRGVVVKATGRNVGYVSLAPLAQVQGHPTEISYDIVRECWGNGYATEAAARLIEHAFEELLLPEVVAAIHPLNVASARVVEKLGLTVREKIEWPKQGLVELYAIGRDTYEEWCRRSSSATT
jgi:RimJ/RimL family protein N-acetyltransferase